MLPASFKYSGHRNSYTELNCLYFRTITIKEWMHLLLNDEYKKYYNWKLTMALQ